MFMPSERIWQEMKSEPAGFWPVPINTGHEYAFLTKIPTYVVKAAYRSAPVALDVACAGTPVGNVMATVLHIAADPASPLGVSGVQRHPEEQAALSEILRAGRTLFVFFDELSRPVARANCALEPSAAAEALDRIEAGGWWYAGPWTPTLTEVLDEVDAIADPTQRTGPTRLVTSQTRIRLTLSGFETSRITTVGRHEVVDARLEDEDEGHGLEQATWHLLEDLFAGNIFHSPQVVEPGGARELTDILGVCASGCCLVEAKAAAVLTTNMNRSTTRRASNIQKQIDKGIGQITGALRNLSAGRPVLTQSGGPVNWVARGEHLRVCVIMVSELLPSVDWEAVSHRLVEVSSTTGASVVILDLQELRTLVGVSRTAAGFLALCARRYRLMAESGTALIRTKLDAPPPP